MLVAAEASGDQLGAGLARALRARLGEGVRFVGVGGPAMAAEGVESPFGLGELSILGLVEGLRAYPRVVRLADVAADLAVRERPDVAVLIDAWGYTLRVARRLRRRLPALPLIKYVGPQVWASRPGRARTLARSVDLLLSIHAFDPPHFEAAGLRTAFVGSRALAQDFNDADPAGFRERIGAIAGERILLVLPGSRPAEVRRLTGPFGEAIGLLSATRPDLRIVVALAPTVADQVREAVRGWRPAPMLIEGEAVRRDAMRTATAALACSGTVSTELALAGAPMVIAYRLGALTYALVKPLMRAPHITLLNIAAGERIAPELVQGDCTGPKLAAALAPLLDDPARAAAQSAAQTAALDRMGRGGPDPSEAAADAVLDLVRSRRSSLPASPTLAPVRFGPDPH